MTKKKRTGRPPVPNAERRSVTPTIRLTPGEAKLIRAAAQAKDQPTTQWMRETLLRAARRIGK
jgi:uncharacterized protein (DUF1778 family)